MSTRVPLYKAPTASPDGANGTNGKHEVVNKILLGLPRKEYKAVWPDKFATAKLAWPMKGWKQ